MATVHTREEDDGDITFILSKRRQRKRSKSVKAWVIAGGVALAIMGTVGMGALAVSSVQQSRRANWTHTELAEYLNSEGVEVYRRPTTGGVFYVSGAMQKWSTDYLDNFFKTGSEGMVYVNLLDNEQKARELASVSEHAFSWGRFVIAGKGDLYNQIRKVLK